MTERTRLSEVQEAVADGVREYWRDSHKQSDAFREWRGGGFIGACPQECDGSIVDYVTRAVWKVVG